VVHRYDITYSRTKNSIMIYSCYNTINAIIVYLYSRNSFVNSVMVAVRRSTIKMAQLFIFYTGVIPSTQTRITQSTIWRRRNRNLNIQFDSSYKIRSLFSSFIILLISSRWLPKIYYQVYNHWTAWAHIIIIWFVNYIYIYIYISIYIISIIYYIIIQHVT